MFVSSTLRELADERRAVRAAIERLRLAPVMFELGARPHPPRALYRAYLAQSDVFVGIYGDSYGWVAPDEEVSGLEDEYNLAPRVDAEAHLHQGIASTATSGSNELIDRIRSDDTAAYLPFETAAELEEQVAGDLATLLAERFDESRAAADADAGSRRRPLVARMPGPLHGDDRPRGRPRAGARAARARRRPGRQPDRPRRHRQEPARDRGRARAAEDLFPDGIYFVLLEGVLEPGLLAADDRATALGIRDNGEAALEERIARALDGPARAGRARQLRADRGRRARARAAVRRRAAARSSS